jgi:hypothetical protein
MGRVQLQIEELISPRPQIAFPLGVPRWRHPRQEPRSRLPQAQWLAPFGAGPRRAAPLRWKQVDRWSFRYFVSLPISPTRSAILIGLHMSLLARIHERDQGRLVGMRGDPYAGSGACGKIWRDKICGEEGLGHLARQAKLQRLARVADEADA